MSKTKREKTLIRTFFVGDIRGEDRDEDTYHIQGKASVEVEDSHGTIIKLDGMQLDKFRNNPIMRFQHDKPIGKWTSVERSGDALIVEGDISKTSVGLDVIRLLKDKAIKGLSIGFWPLRYDFPVDGGDEPIIITESILAEVSVVDLPSNLEAWLNSAKADAPVAIRDWDSTETKPEDKPTMDPEKEKELREKYSALATKVDDLSAKLDALIEERKSDPEAEKKDDDPITALVEEIRNLRTDVAGLSEKPEDPESRSEEKEDSEKEPESEKETDTRDYGKAKGDAGTDEKAGADKTAKNAEKMRLRLMSKEDRDLAKAEGE